MRRARLGDCLSDFDGRKVTYLFLPPGSLPGKWVIVRSICGSVTESVRFRRSLEVKPRRSLAGRFSFC